MSYTYQQLGVEDVHILKELLGVFGEAFGDMDAYQSAVPRDAYLQSLLTKPGFIALATVAGDRVVGGLVAYVLEKFEQERSEIYIYDLAVQEQHRRKGIATGLINRLRQIAQELGAYVIYVQAPTKWMTRLLGCTNHWEQKRTFSILILRRDRDIARTPLLLRFRCTKPIVFIWASAPG